MKNIYITGSSGFVGQYFLKKFKNIFNFIAYQKGEEIKIFDEIILHFAGKSNDLKFVSCPEEYYSVNTEFTMQIFDAFLKSESYVFIFLSSVKAIKDEVEIELFEDEIATPITHYGKSKLLAEEYILSKEIPCGKRFYILRSSMIHGPGNRGNLNSLFQLGTYNIPWILGAFENKRSFCNIENLMFILKEIIDRDDIPSGVYNVADDESLSTNEVISILAESLNKKPFIWKVSKSLIQFVAKLGNVLKLPLNEERLHKLTGSYVVSNKKIKNAIGKPLPFSSKEGLLKTFQSFQ